MNDHKRQILVCVAWPYANGLQHIGHIAGAYLPPDIFARYQRMRGNDVLMVSGSDTHGTPITVKAEEEGKTPESVVDYYHGKFIECYQRLGLTFDVFTHTHTANHEQVVHEFFSDLLSKNLIYKDVSKQLFDPRPINFCRIVTLKGPALIVILPTHVATSAIIAVKPTMPLN